MAGAPYQVDQTLSSGTTLEFSAEWRLEDGSDFPWSDYTVSYTTHRDGCLYWCCGSETLTQGGGITIDPDQNLITFTLAPHVGAGRYTHGCIVTHVSTGKSLPIFDGTLTIAGDCR